MNNDFHWTPIFIGVTTFYTRHTGESMPPYHDTGPVSSVFDGLDGNS